MAIERTYKLLGQRIRAGRIRRKAKQVPFAKRVGISRPALVNIELGRQRVVLHQVKCFAKAIGVTPATLMRGIW